MKNYFAEAVGTFVLVFIGTGAIILHTQNEVSFNHLSVSLSFGLAVCAMIYAFARISGAHINPAVSLAFWVNKQLAQKDLIPYLVAQCTGALLASYCLKQLSPHHPSLGSTLPQTGVFNTFMIEGFMSFLLMFLILMLSNRGTQSLHLPAIGIGACVALEAYFGGPFTGASMNPARSLGPALVSGRVESLWVYLLAPVLGMLVAVALYRASNWNSTR
ncbi:MAG: aquaporin [Bacteroidota bacterium]|nr:aquaporin [Bacteroidota bacterium]MDX5430059.1 aquaporin [Bacteroidota bacterium]MDX5468829.1 aquaporin [Bacteroidota bacterium]